MTKLNFLRQSSLDRLQANITSNLNRYLEDSPWLSKYFSGPNWFLESNIGIDAPIKLQLPTAKAELLDLENTKILYSALKHLTPVQASDPRLWCYMAHVTHWEYMRKRWPVEQYLKRPRLKENIQEHYFFMSDRSRALTRNGMARLWWYGFCSYDEARSNPFELTAVLLKNLDIAGTILERTFSRNTTITRTFLSILLEREKAGKEFYVREKVRELAKHLIRIGGVTIIDALPEPELRNLVTVKIDQLNQTATS